MILRLANRDIFHILKLLDKMFCVALEDQTSERDVPHASQRFITLLNAFNKVLSCAQMAPGRAVVYVFAQHLSLLSCLFALLATAKHYCVLLHERQLVQYDEGKKKKTKFPNQLLMSSREVQAAGSRPRFLLRVRRLAPVHADGTSLPDFIWGNQIPPLLPSERRSISSHMSTRFVRLFITINCCST